MEEDSNRSPWCFLYLPILRHADQTTRAFFVSEMNIQRCSVSTEWRTLAAPCPEEPTVVTVIQSCDKAKEILPLFLQLNIRTGKCEQAFSNCDYDPLSETHLLCDAALPPELCIPGPHHLVLTTSGTTWRWKHFNHVVPTRLRAVLFCFVFFA